MVNICNFYIVDDVVAKQLLVKMSYSACVDGLIEECVDCLNVNSMDKYIDWWINCDSKDYDSFNGDIEDWSCCCEQENDICLFNEVDVDSIVDGLICSFKPDEVEVNGCKYKKVV